jgi:hypothetical protein
LFEVDVPFDTDELFEVDVPFDTDELFEMDALFEIDALFEVDALLDAEMLLDEFTPLDREWLCELEYRSDTLIVLFRNPPCIPMRICLYCLMTSYLANDGSRAETEALP